MSRHHSTKIVATVGPASLDPNTLASLVVAGVDVFRINFSYGTAEDNERAVAAIRDAVAAAGKPIAVLQDLQGPKIRIGGLEAPRAHDAGDTIVFVPDGHDGSGAAIALDFPQLARVVSVGDRMIAGDGEAELRVTAIAGDEVQAVATRQGRLRPRQGLNLPGVALRREAITAKDRTDLARGVALGVDYIALSFVRDGDDIRELKRLIRERGADIPVVAKIETREAVAALDDILSVSDAIMVARGDLGLDFSVEEVPHLQKQIIRAANGRGIPVITATQMLESMIANPTPTRAEASDVANAMLDGTAAVMLSAETAVGRYPVEAVRMMGRIAGVTEPDLPRLAGAPGRAAAPATAAEAMSRAACELAHDLAASAIVIFTRTGYSARLVSRDRPSVPVIAFTPSATVSRQLALWFGVRPVVSEFPQSVEQMLETVDRWLAGPDAPPECRLVILAHWSERDDGVWSNFLKLHRPAI